MFNGVLLVAIIATWILKVTSLPKLCYRFFNFGIQTALLANKREKTLYSALMSVCRKACKIFLIFEALYHQEIIYHILLIDCNKIG